MTDPFTPADVQRLADAQPVPLANPPGDAARAALVRRIKRATTGEYTDGRFWSKPVPFREIFFPGTPASGSDARIDQVTGLSGAFFAEFAAAVLCGQMVVSTSRLRPQLVSAAIDAGLAEFNRNLREHHAWAWYAEVLGTDAGPIQTAMRPFTTDDARRRAREQYAAGLTSPTWINLKQSQWDLGEWTDREWELIHHWTKLAMLGTPVTEIDRVIAAVQAGGLEIPPALGPGTWPTYTPWLRQLGAADAADAAGPIRQTTYTPLPQGPPAAIAEGYSYAFTSDSGPGSAYRSVPPPSSCFAPGTRVVLADGQLRAIELITPGEYVHTPAGPREVLLCLAPRRDGRALVRLAGLEFAFAASHPFVVRDPGADDPTYAAADPLDLARAVPSLATYGIGPLAGDAPVTLSRYTQHGDLPFPVGEVVTAPHVRPEFLHDLFVAVGPDGRSEYYAGDAETQLLVSSEAPRFAAAPRTAEVVVATLEALTPVVLATLHGVPDHAFAELASIGLDGLARELLATIGPRLREVATANAVATADVVAATDPVATAEVVAAFARRAAGQDPASRRRVGTVVEQFVATFAPSFEATVALGWRVFPTRPGSAGTVLAVSVYELDLLARPGQVPADRAMVEVELRRGRYQASHRLEVRPAAASDRFCYPVDAVTYFPGWRPDDVGPAVAQHEPDWELRLRIVGDPAEAVIGLPGRLEPAFQVLTGELVDPDGRTVGRVGLDVRALRATDLIAEARAQQAWDPRDEPALARALTGLAVRELVERFAPVLGALRFLAIADDSAAGG